MPGRDDHRSNREYEEYERRRREMDRDPQRRMGGAERRSFEDRGRFGGDDARYAAQNQRGRLGDYPGATGDAEAWRSERAGSRYDQERARYGSGRDQDRWRQQFRDWREEHRGRQDERGDQRSVRQDNFGYGGQEYGIEAHGGYGGAGGDFARTSSIVQRTTDGGSGRRLEERFGQDDRGDPPFRGEQRSGSGQSGHVTWRDDGAPYGDSHLDRQDRAMQEFGVPHDYGFHPHDDEFEPHYTHWRDEQMRRHDDEYQRWRTQQLRQYDEDYRAWRGERRQSFGQTFSQWRIQRSSPTKDSSESDVSNAGSALGGDQASASAGAKPEMTPGGSVPTAPAVQDAGQPKDAQSGSNAGGDVGFAQVSPAVQKATDGEARGGGARDNDNDRDRDDLS